MKNMLIQYLNQISYFLLGGVFIAVAVSDLRSRRIPNMLLLTALAVKAAYFLVLFLADHGYILDFLVSLLIFLTVGFICCLAWKITGGTGAVIGGGDLKYLAVLSFCLSANQWIVAALISITLLLLAWFLCILRGRRGVRIPAGTYLSAGAVTVCVISFFETLIL